MNTLEFSTKIEQGFIRLPTSYQNYENLYVRVTVVLEVPQNYLAKREKLLATFRKMKAYDMFQSIESPSAWQKQLRNEWE